MPTNVGLGGGEHASYQKRGTATLFFDQLNELDDNEHDDFMMVNPGDVNGGVSLFRDEMTSRVPLAKATLFDDGMKSDGNFLKHNDMDAIEYENMPETQNFGDRDIEGYSYITKQEQALEGSEMPVKRRTVIRMPEEIEEPVELVITKPLPMTHISDANSLVYKRLSKLKFINTGTKLSIPRVSFGINGKFTIMNTLKSSSKIQIGQLKLPKTEKPVINFENPEKLVTDDSGLIKPVITDSVENAGSDMFHHLVHALFGKLTVREEYFLEDSKQDVKLDHIRKRRLNQFFRKYLKIRQSSQPVECNEVLESLKLGRFQQASNQALKQRQPLLATVIQKVFLSGLSNMEINQYKSDYLQNLIFNWRTSKTDRHVDHDTLQCYSLVAGFPQFETSDRTVIDNCKGLDWLSLLALQFWFFSEPDDEISQVLVKFKELREKLNLDFATPVQAWDANNNDTKLENFARKAPCYHLLEFFCDPNVVSIANVVDPLNFSDNQLRVEESWHAWRALAQTEELNSLLTRENENYINAASTRLHTAYRMVLLSVSRKCRNWSKAQNALKTHSNALKHTKNTLDMTFFPPKNHIFSQNFHIL